MKILLANKYFYKRGGAENSFFETARLLKEKGHEVVFFSMKHPDNMPSEYEKHFVDYVDYEKKGFLNKMDVSMKLLYSFEASKKLEKLLEAEKPDIAHLNVIYHQISPSIIHTLKKFNIPIVMSLRDYKIICASYTMVNNNSYCEACKNSRYFECLLKKCVKNSWEKSLLNTIEMYLHHSLLKIYDKVDTFISPSKFLKEKVAEMGFKGHVEYLPNFVDLNSFHPDYGCKDKSIIYFGRLSSEKGLFTLIDAIKRLPKILLKIVGDGPIREDLETAIQKNNLSNVKSLGYLTGNSLKQEISRSEAVVVPSEWYENNPRSVIEGFALGKPAIGARIGGIPELVIDNKTGLSFESGNSEDLKDKIRVLTDDPAKAEQYGKNARKFAEENLNQETHYHKLIEIYKEAIKKHR